MAAIEAFQEDDYATNYAEAQRRGPTHFPGPLIAIHIGLYHPSPFDAFFERHLAILLECIGYPRSDEAARNVFLHLTPPPNQDDAQANAAGDRRSARANRKQRYPADFIFETDHPHFERGTWRLEVHRDFIAITLLVGLSVVEHDQFVEFALPPSKGAAAKDRQRPLRVALDKSYVDGAFETVFSTLSNFVIGKFDAPLHKLDKLYRSEEFEERKHSAAEHPEQNRERVRRAEIFCYVQGAIVPWNTFAYGLNEVDTPKFADPDGPGLEKSDGKVSYADRFLATLWPTGIGRHVTNDIGVARQPDSIACFLQNGHALYVSNLGHRADQNDPSPLKYLLMYEAGAERPKPQEVSGAGRSSARRRRTPPPLPKQVTWRLSRLVGRLHTLAAARLAALRDQDAMTNFAEQLREVERTLQWDMNADHAVVERAERDLRQHARALDFPLIYRSHRARYHFETVRTLSQDLGVIVLPRYQPYDHFVRRRLYNKMAYLSGLGRRYEDLLAQIRGIFALRSSKKILIIQELADIFGSIIFTYYSMELAGRIFERAYEIAPVVLPFLFQTWGLPEKHWISIVELVAGGLVYLATAGRIWDIAKGWKKRGDDRNARRREAAAKGLHQAAHEDDERHQSYLMQYYLALSYVSFYLVIKAVANYAIGVAVALREPRRR